MLVTNSDWNAIHISVMDFGSEDLREGVGPFSINCCFEQISKIVGRRCLVTVTIFNSIVHNLSIIHKH